MTHGWKQRSSLLSKEKNRAAETDRSGGWIDLLRGGGNVADPTVLGLGDGNRTDIATGIPRLLASSYIFDLSGSTSPAPCFSILARLVAYFCQSRRHRLPGVGILKNLFTGPQFMRELIKLSAH